MADVRPGLSSTSESGGLALGDMTGRRDDGRGAHGRVGHAHSIR
jgi:hypothetical protein